MIALRRGGAGGLPGEQLGREAYRPGLGPWVAEPFEKEIGVYHASPDRAMGRPEELTPHLEDGPRGRELVIILPELSFFSLVVAEIEL